MATFSYPQLQQLWIKYGGSRASAPLAAAIAMAESSGRSNASNGNTNGSIDRGLWQINSVHGGQSTFDIAGNVRAAIAISNNGRSWSPWTTFNTGAYKRYLGGPATAPVSITGGGSRRPSRGGATQPSSTSFMTSGGQPDYRAAGLAALMAGANRRIDTSGKVTEDNVLGRLLNNVSSGLYTTPVTNTVTHVFGNSSAGSGHPPAGPTHMGNFAGYVNPISGAIIGRTDMGLDASGLPNGHPIRAIANSRVVGISPNWYAGQPYVLFQFLDGPHKGRYYYIAEAINPSVHAGQTVRAGQTVGTYNSSGTGLELGWGSPVPGRTLAQAQGNTGDASHNNAPAGIDFTHFFHSLHR